MRSTLPREIASERESATLARQMHQATPPAPFASIPKRSILTAAIPESDRRAPAGMSARLSAFPQSIHMSDANAQSVENRIAGLVRRLLVEHSIDRVVAPEEDLRLAGLSSLDMVSLVLAVEEEFELMVPEGNIMPSNFRSVASISRLVETLRKS
jgi:acyl carrier protein